MLLGEEERREMIRRGNGKSTMTKEEVLDAIKSLEDQQPPEEYWLQICGQTFFGESKNEVYTKATKHFLRGEK